ncbi:MAG: hypothetical protein RJB39_757 [Candidatus Parcubacteria bacterium]|jgi:hypothetical protein
MKKILLVVVLVGVAYFIGGNVSDAINGKDNTAQAYAGTATTQVQEAGNLKLATKKGIVYLSEDVKIKTTDSAPVTFLTPAVFKDGQPYTVSPSVFTAYIKRINSPRFRSGVITTGPTVTPKKGNYTYAVQWILKETDLTPGIYTMTLNGYTIATGTVATTTATSTIPTIYPLTKRSDTTIIRPTTPASIVTNLENMAFRLYSVGGTTVPASSTIDMSFGGGRINLKVCALMTGVYKVKDSRIATKYLQPSQARCGVVNGMDYNVLDQMFNKAFKDIPLIFLSGDKLTISSPTSGVFVFDKISAIGAPLTPQGPAVINGVKVYPCNFIGPLEVGAVRDCGTGILGGTGGTILSSSMTPVITGISPASARIGATTTITVTNLTATNNVVLFDGNIGTTQTTVNGNVLTFVVPSQISLMCAVLGTCASASQQPVTARTYNVSVLNTNGTSNAVSFTVSAQ